MEISEKQLLEQIIKQANIVLNQKACFGQYSYFTCNEVKHRMWKELFDFVYSIEQDHPDEYNFVIKVFNGAQNVFVNMYNTDYTSYVSFITSMVEYKEFREQRPDINMSDKEVLIKYRVIWLHTLIDYCTDLLESYK